MSNDAGFSTGQLNAGSCHGLVCQDGLEHDQWLRLPCGFARVAREAEDEHI